MITSLLQQQPWDLDRISRGMALVELRDCAVRKFREAARFIERDEEKERRRVSLIARLKPSKTAARKAIQPRGGVKGGKPRI